ncbi:biopolymer transporter ExbD [Pantoea sp. Mhis]|uniref:biopolymer transporter ExbD n=1 Tax=Pantoea sp. Mhis TaxID=2576759 RepID=UPI001356C07A|nr:biopolymer transporter ExbD [Pantoea sp. Mhis]MXP56291.1 protein TolR [Pantoea sp. Mhis]
MPRIRGYNSYRNIQSGINIVPLLDVFLILLITLMISIPNTNQSIEVNLPDADISQSVFNENNSIVIIEILDIKQYRLLVNNIHMKLSAEEMIYEINNRIKSNPKTIFLIGATKLIPYDEVINILNLLHKCGVKSVGLMTHPI